MTREGAVAHADHGKREVLAEAESLALDASFRRVAQWRANGGKAVGCAPAYVPTELIDAAGALPVHLTGGGPHLEVIQGDAYFQSAICHLPRSIIDQGLAGALDPLDMVIIPSTCDVLRNLTGTFQITWPKRPVRYLDLPQRYDADGRTYYRRELEILKHEIERATGGTITDDSLRRSIALHNRRRAVLAKIDALRVEEPWRAPTSELFVMVRAGAVIPTEQHVALLERYLAASKSALARPLDVARVVLTGAFCEQPPIGFLRTLERAGCAIVEDDLLLGMRWFRSPVSESGDPLDALIDAYMTMSPLAPCRYEGEQRRPEALLRTVRETRAQGVILASPSFCDPALLDRPGLLDALERASIPSLQLQYAENSADFGSVREQAGTFADALRLWEVA